MDWERVGYDAMDEFNTQGAKAFDQSNANKALAEIFLNYAKTQEQQVLPEGVEMNPHALNQQAAGRSTIEKAALSPNLRDIPTGSIASVMAPFLKQIAGPADFASQQWTKAENIKDQRATDFIKKKELQTQAETAREKLAQERKDYFEQIQRMVINKEITPEEGRAAVLVKLGLQPQAKASGPMADYEAYKALPEEEKAEYNKFKTIVPQFNVDNRRDPRELRDRLTMGADEGGQFILNLDTGEKKYVAGGKVLATSPADPDAPQIDWNAPKAKSWPSKVGDTVKSWFIGEAPVPAKAPDPDKRPSAPQKAAAATVFNSLPPAAQYPNRTITDNATGQKMKSNGKAWVRVK